MRYIIDRVALLILPLRPQHINSDALITFNPTTNHTGAKSVLNGKYGRYRRKRQRGDRHTDTMPTATILLGTLLLAYKDTSSILITQAN